MAPRLIRASGATLVAVLVLSACGNQAPTPSDSSASASPSPPPTATEDDDESVLVLPSHGILPLSNVVSFDQGAAGGEQLAVHAALYRLDDRLAPVPELADECIPSEDGRVVTCSLLDATFHDGSPVTADDVAFSYAVALSPACPFRNPFGPSPVCPGGWLESVTAADARTVEFRLARPHAPLMTEVLPNVFITPRRVIEAQYRELVERSAGLDPSEVVAVADAIAAGLASEPQECESQIDAAEAYLDAAGAAYALHREAPMIAGIVVRPDQRFDPCNYAPLLGFLLRILADVPASEGIDGIAAAYPLLPFNEAPIGAGVYRVERLAPGRELVLAAFDDYVGGRAQIDRIRWEVLDDASAIEAYRRGELHVLFSMPPNEADLPDTEVKEISRFEWTGLHFNVRSGALFADRDLRRAVRLCSDFPRAVAAATDGGKPIVSPVVPTSHWAFQADLEPADRDVDRARELIEAAGWTSAADGVFERDGRRLAFPVLVRANQASRVQFLELLADQLSDCGMEMTVAPFDFFDDLLPMLATPPHIAPGTDQPFGAYFGGFTIGLDPNYNFDIFHSSRVPDGGEGQSTFYNFGGFSHPEADALLEDGLATYDLSERARIYRELQVLLEYEAPVLFAWNGTARQAVSDRLASSSGPLSAESPNWSWQQEALILLPGD